jgi:hypothetical protein
MIFYVLVFGLLGIFVVVVGVMKMRGSRRRYYADERAVTGGGGAEHGSTPYHEAGHHPHATESARRSRKAKRAESQHDRRKRK